MVSELWEKKGRVWGWNEMAGEGWYGLWPYIWRGEWVSRFWSMWGMEKGSGWLSGAVGRERGGQGWCLAWEGIADVGFKQVARLEIYSCVPPLATSKHKRQGERVHATVIFDQREGGMLEWSMLGFGGVSN
jgi:hypothetical protein